MGGFIASAPNQEEIRNYLQFLQNPPPAAVSHSTVPVVVLSDTLGSALQLYNSFILQKSSKRGQEEWLRSHIMHGNTQQSKAADRAAADTKFCWTKTREHCMSCSTGRGSQRPILLRGENF